MGTRERLAEHFPVFALEVRTPLLTLRYPDDDDLLDLADLAARGVHEPGEQPFAVPWTNVAQPHQGRNHLEFVWSQRATSQTNDWCIPLVTVVDGEIVGSQGLMGQRWAATKVFETGSWLGTAHQGRGIGKEMRRAGIHLGFVGFGAEIAVTSAFADNPASLGVTRALGYEENGIDWFDRGEEGVELQRFAMSRADWLARNVADIEIVGAEPVVEVFGTAVQPEWNKPDAGA